MKSFLYVVVMLIATMVLASFAPAPAEACCLGRILKAPFKAGKAIVQARPRVLPRNRR